MISQLVIDPSLDIQMSSMSLTTCLVLCQARTDTIHVAVLLGTRCICTKGDFKIKFRERLNDVHDGLQVNIKM